MCAGLITTVMFYPLNTRKVLAQAQSPQALALARPFAGIRTDASGTALGTGVYFLVYESIRMQPMPIPTAAASTAAIAASSCITAPCGVWTRRRQIRENAPGLKLAPVHPRTFVTAYYLSLLRNIPRVALKYTIYENLMASLAVCLTMSNGARGALSAALASIACVIIFAPIDYVRTHTTTHGMRWQHVAKNPLLLFSGYREAMAHTVLSNAVGHALLEMAAPR